jgi:hypothetical protein
MHPLFALGVAVGFAAGALLGYVATKRVVERIAVLGRATIVRTCAYGAALIAVVPGSFYAFVLGGTLGGGWAAFLFGQSQWALGSGSLSLSQSAYSWLRCAVDF